MGIGLSLDIVRKSSQDSKHSNNSQQQKSKREENQHELIEEIPEENVTSQPEYERDQRPRPTLCQPGLPVIRELYAPPGGRHLYPCPDHTSDEAKNGGDVSPTNKELDDGEQNQDQAAVLPLHKHSRPY